MSPPDSEDNKTTSSGTISGTSTRLGRTKVNPGLAPGNQQLDERLQLSRPSVLQDMSTARGGDLPAGVLKLISEQGTVGRYAINRPLAAGGMGAVLHIEDHDFRRGAAMKVIHGQFAEDPQATERFLAEAQVTAQLEHPNIVPIHDMGVMADGSLYFTMKLIEGQSLGQIVKLLRLHAGLNPMDPRKSPEEKEAERQRAARVAQAWTQDEKIHVFLKILDGVGYANAKGVVHRDLKPDNVMIGGHGEVLVVDWGIAKVLNREEVTAETRQVVSLRDEQSFSATMAGSALGTIYYMPPEQARGDLVNIGAHSDVYALGATMYEVFSLKRSIEGGDMEELLAKVIAGDFIRLEKVAPQLEPDLIAIVHKSMALDFTKRYPTCAAMADDLRRFLAGQSVVARRRTVLERAARWIATHRMQFAGVAAAVVIAGVAATVGVMHSQAEARRRSAEQAAVASNELTAFEAGDTAALTRAQEAISAAAGLAPGDQDVVAIKSKVDAALGVVEARRSAEAAIVAAREQSRKLLTQARERRVAGDLIEADKLLTSAVRLAPADSEIDGERLDVVRLLADVQRKEAVSQAARRLTEADRALAEAKVLAATDTTRDDLLRTADVALAEAVKLAPVEGAAERAGQVALLRREGEQARARQAAVAKAAEAKARAVTALAALRYDDAKAAIGAALGHTPDDSELIDLRGKITNEAAAAAVVAQRESRLTAARLKAEALLVEATMQSKRSREAGSVALRGEAEVVRQRTLLASEPLERKAPLFAAQREAASQRRQEAESWSAAEVAAQNVLAVMAEEPTQPAVTSAKGILADLYQARLRQARAVHDLIQVAAFTNLLRRFDNGTYEKELKDIAALTVTGTALPLVVKLLEDAAGDGRLMPLGDATTWPAGQPIDLQAGAYQLTAGGLSLVALARSDQPTTVVWPGAVPQIAGHQLSYVLPAAGARPYLLGTTEVTQAQWLEFISQPEQLAKINSVRRKNAEVDDLSKMVHFPWLPTDNRFSPKLFTPKDGPAVKDGPAAGDWTAFVLTKAGRRNSPVHSITWHEAKDFCAWLSIYTSQKVRLPTSAEWTWAATGGDDRRVYPWGQLFDSAFTVCHAGGVEGPVEAGAHPHDVGPFGVRGQAGNVREWLAADGATPSRVPLAGGSWADDAEFEFRVSTVVAADPGFASEAIGFRILVEIP